ncbi:MAG: hypothetical protein ACLGI3_03655 [Actinomycetes bacterium]
MGAEGRAVSHRDLPVRAGSRCGAAEPGRAQPAAAVVAAVLLIGVAEGATGRNRHRA